MSEFIRPPAQSSVDSITISCENAAYFYRHAADLDSAGFMRETLVSRAAQYQVLTDELRELIRKKGVLPATRDEDLEWTKAIALRIKVTLAIDEEDVLLKHCGKVERDVIYAVADAGLFILPVELQVLLLKIWEAAKDGIIWIWRVRPAYGRHDLQ